MAWELEIHTIDVGEGESTLIIAHEPTDGQTRTMLVDGGKAEYAETVHRYVSSYLDKVPLDHILVTGYGPEHVKGVARLLNADNLHFLAKAIADAAVELAHSVIVPNALDRRFIAAATAAYLACLGGYAGPGGLDPSEEVTNVTARALNQIAGGGGDRDIINQVAWIVETIKQKDGLNGFNPSLMIEKELRKGIAEVAAGAVRVEFSGLNDIFSNVPYGVQVAIRFRVRRAIIKYLKLRVPHGACFLTNGIYADTHIMAVPLKKDYSPPGAIELFNMAQGYTLSPQPGEQGQGETVVRPPGVLRLSTEPILGAEILWNSGPTPKPVPDGAPAVFVVASDGTVWNGSSKPLSIPDISSTADRSIALLVRFNDFSHYMGGDLPSKGSELVADAVTSRALSYPGRTAPPGNITSIKCGSHGDNTATSQVFLNTARPSIAFISCGESDNENPDQNVINRLIGSVNAPTIFLTNCNYNRTATPVSRMVVCGDNQVPNERQNRFQGDVVLFVGAHDSVATPDIDGSDNRMLHNLTVAHLQTNGQYRSHTLNAMIP